MPLLPGTGEPLISLAKIFRFSSAFFNSLAKNVVTMHRRQIRQKRKASHTSRPFTPYTKKYAELKSQGLAAKGRQQMSNSTVPDLTLTGDMLNSMKVLHAGRDNFSYGITDPVQAAKMEGNQLGVFGKGVRRSKKRIVSSENNPMPKEIREMVMEEMSKQVVRQITTELRRAGHGYKVITI